MSLLNSIVADGASFFCNQFGTPMGFMKLEKHFECWPLRSKKFRAVLRNLGKKDPTFAVKGSRLKKLIIQMEDEAELKEINVNNRFATGGAANFLSILPTILGSTSSLTI